MPDFSCGRRLASGQLASLGAFNIAPRFASLALSSNRDELW